MPYKKLLLSSICIFILAVSLTTVIMLNQGDEPQRKMLESQISSLNSQLTSAYSEKSGLESQVSDLQTNVTVLETDKVALQALVSNLQLEITNLESEVTQSYNNGFEDGKSESPQKIVVDIVRDPTYLEVLEFIISDETDKNTYGDDYVCMNYVADFNNNAFNAGFRAGCVYIRFPERVHHGISCFNTVDEGLIFVEPQTDEIVTLTVGEVYWNRSIYEPPYYDDTIVHYVIIW